MFEILATETVTLPRRAHKSAAGSRKEKEEWYLHRDVQIPGNRMDEEISE